MGFGIKPVPTKPSVRRYWWPSVNSVKFGNRFSIGRSAKIGFLGEGLRYLVGTPTRSAMTSDLVAERHSLRLMLSSLRLAV